MRRHRFPTFKSICNGKAIRGAPLYIAQEYERLANEAAGDKDHVLEQTYRQHAEHWTRHNEIEKGR